MRLFNRSFLIPAIVCASAIALAILYIRFYEPDRTAYPMRGIDVSHHQKEIDWRKVARDDVSFAFIKATEGGDHRDTRFAVNWKEAQAAGLKVGAYHFFTFCRPGSDQARNFLDALGTDEGSLPAALDLEFGGNCNVTPAPSAIRAEIDRFLEPVERHTGKPVVLYVTPEFWDAYQHILPERPLWIRSLFWKPPQKEWSVWQYRNAGRVDGISGRVDLNVVRDMDALSPGH
ncbi:GH25 family lysozyme [Microvirga calopogonii]|uniref:GH25 family lysozyme n=1 Tax=Microvirga calopogonii TaxID=2078013 RepID=UPI000E0DAC37|nr:GH25 family lysozyme [Microvirga calopogonii]